MPMPDTPIHQGASGEVRALVIAGRRCVLWSGIFSLLVLARTGLAQQPNDVPPPVSIRETQITRPEIPEDISPAQNLSIPGPDGNTVIAVLRQPPGQGLFPVVIYLRGGRESRTLDQLR